MPMVHEFGVMLTDPKPGERYDTYEPQKYGCITVRDETVENFGDAVLRDLPCYWHTVDVLGKGLAYCGVTLIPPAVFPQFSAAVGENAPLRELIAKAAAENRFIIHFGL